MKRSILSFSGIIILGLIVVLLNAISQTLFRSATADLTEEGLYSLSDGTRNIIDQLKDPVTLRLYFSRTEGAKNPGLKLYGSRVEDLLREYERNGRSKIVLQVADPRPDTEDEEWAQKYGLTPVALPGGEQIFFGLVGVNSEGQEEAIPFFNFSRQEFLEYDVTKLISSLAASRRPKFAVLSSLPVKGDVTSPFSPSPGRSEPWFFTNQLAQAGVVEYLDPNGASVGEGTDVLLVIHPKQVGEQLLYAIDQFVLRGGKMFVAVDPYCQADEPQQDPNNPAAPMFAERTSSLKPILSGWGVDLQEKKVVGDRSLAAQVNGPGGQPIDYVGWVNLTGAELSRSDVTTSALENILLPWPGALQLKETADVRFEKLMQSSTDAKLYDDSAFKFNGGDPIALLEKFVPDNQTYLFAVRLTGKLKTNFPNGRPAAAAGAPPPPADPKAEHLTASKTVSNVIVVADADFLGDRFSVQQQNFLGTRLVSLFNDNLVFLQNALENLAGSEDLISLRSRGRFSRPFTVVQALERRAQQRWQQEEAVFQAKLNNANQQLSQLQSQGQPGQKLFTSTLLETIRKFREERKRAQDRLRDVRRNLRQDKERLGNILFLLNTFAVPLLLVAGTIVWHSLRARGKR